MSLNGRTTRNAVNFVSIFLGEGQFSLPPTPHRLTQEAVHRLALLHARRNHRPNPLAKLTTAFASRPLRDVPVDHHEPDRLFRQVVRRFDTRRRHDHEVGRTVLGKPLLHVLPVLRRRTAKTNLQHPVTGRLQSGLEHSLGKRLSLVDHLEQALQRGPQVLPITAVPLIGQRRQELHIADQVSQTKLQTHATLPHVAAIGREIVAAQNALELLAQDVHQYLRIAVSINVIQGVQFGPETPGPPTRTIVLVTRLIDIEDVFLGQQQQQLLVRLFQSRADLAQDLAQLTSGNGDTRDIAEEAGINLALLNYYFRSKEKLFGIVMMENFIRPCF